MKHQTEWVYQYDGEGNRIGLVEVECAEPDDTHIIDDDSRWFAPYEKEIIRRERQRQVRYDISFRERAIADMETKVLQERFKSGYCPAEFDEVIEDWYQTDTGNWKRHRIHVTSQNVPYIYTEIQKRLSSFGVNHMTFVDIREVLEIVSAAYQSADVQGLDKPLIRLSHSQLKKSA